MSSKSGEELWDEFKTEFSALLNHMDEPTRDLLMRLTLENKELMKENAQLRQDYSRMKNRALSIRPRRRR